MRSNCLLLLAMLFLFVSNVKGQKDRIAKETPITVTTYTFEKGNFVFDVERILSLRTNNSYSNDVKYGEGRNVNIDVGFDYMFRRNWGVGFDLSSDIRNWENSTETKSREWMGWLNLTYGRQINSNVSWYVKPSVGYGGQTFITKSNNATVEDEYNTLGFRLNTGFPILLNGGPVYLNPNLTYKRYCTDFENGEESMNRFSVGLSFLASMNREEFACDHKQNYRQANMRYNQGSSYFGYYTRSMYSFGGYETQYNHTSNTYENDFSDAKLRVDYSYYFLNNFYGGAELRFGNNTRESGSQLNYKYTNSEFMFTPKIGLNIPGKAPLNNTFLEFAAGWGSEKIKVDNNGIVNEDKDKLSSYTGTLGYNIFFGNQLSFTPMLRYEIRNIEPKNSTLNQEEQDKGWAFRLGVRYFLEKF